MKILLSIKPEFAQQIFNGNKKYEYRRILFKNRLIKTVVLYASSPIKQVVGEFEISYILQDNKENLWNKTKEFSGISKEYFDEYFADKEIANAIGIKNVKKYAEPKNLKNDFNIGFAPQSFIYLSDIIN